MLNVGSRPKKHSEKHPENHLEKQAVLDSKALPVPPVGALKDLLRLTQQGNLQKLRQRLDTLEQSDPDYRAFVALLRELVGQMQTKAIEQQLYDYLSRYPYEQLLVEA